MGDSQAPVGPDVIFYLDRSDIRTDRIEDLKVAIRTLVAVVEAREPQLVAYAFHLDEKSSRMYVTAVHPDSASLELHMEIGMTEFKKLADMITLRRIEVFGPVSDRALSMLEQKAAMLGGEGVTILDTCAGFSHLTRR